MIDSLLVKLSDIAEIEFADVVTGCDVVEGKLRYVLEYVRDLVYKINQLPKT